MPISIRTILAALVIGLLLTLTACGGGGGTATVIVKMFSPDPDAGADLLIGPNPVTIVCRLSKDNPVQPTFDIMLNSTLVVEDGEMFFTGGGDENTWQCTDNYHVTLVEGTNNIQITVNAGTEIINKSYSLSARAPIDGFVLTWNKDDSDLDMHLIYVPNNHPDDPSVHFYFGTLDSTMNDYNIDPTKFRDNYEGLGPEVIEFKQQTIEFTRDFPIGTYYLAVVYAQDDPDGDGTAAGEIQAVVRIYENSEVIKTYTNITMDTAINGTIAEIDQQSKDLSTLEPAEALHSLATMTVPAEGAITFGDPVTQAELVADVWF